MSTHTDKIARAKNQSVVNSVSQKQHDSESSFEFSDKRSEAITQRKIQAMVDHYSLQHPIQKKENKTGLPNNLKTGVENLSGYSMDDVKVHYNSNKPAQLQAHAYAQGTNIHLASGQEKHLPHEAWHVVQQKQGRVQPTRQLKGKVTVNDDAGLEKEADVMGAKALQMKSSNEMVTQSIQQPDNNGKVVQRMIGAVGEAGVGRYVRRKSSLAIGRIRRFLRHMMQTRNQPMYVLDFSEQKTGAAAGPGLVWAYENDDEYDLVPADENIDEMLMTEPAELPWQFGPQEQQIPLKVSTVQNQSAGTYYEHEGLVYTSAEFTTKRNEAGHVDFVVTQTGELKIGAMHSGLAGWKTVMMAGRLDIVDGVVSYFDNESGHYQPNITEEATGKAILRKRYPWIQGT